MALTDESFTDLYIGDPRGRVGESPYLWKRDGAVSSIPVEHHAECEALYNMALGQKASAFAMSYRGVQLRGQVVEHTFGTAMVLRRLPHSLPRWNDLGMPNGVLSTLMRGENTFDIPSILASKRGLIVLCGETDSGKSTTLAVLLREILDVRPWVATTIEDPAELPLAGKHQQGFCYQRNIPIGGFAEALRESLRTNPDVILLGEIRDADTATTALSAAITGHLVLTTVHASDIPQAVRRLTALAAHDLPQTDTTDLIASCLYCVIHQRLEKLGAVRSAQTGLSNRRLDATVLFTSKATRTLIRDQKYERLNDEITMQRKRLMGSARLTEPTRKPTA